MRGVDVEAGIKVNGGSRWSAACVCRTRSARSLRYRSILANAFRLNSALDETHYESHATPELHV